MESKPDSNKTIIFKNVKTKAQVEKAVTEWLTENSDYAWEGDFHIENKNEAVATFVRCQDHTEFKEVEVSLIRNNSHA